MTSSLLDLRLEAALGALESEGLRRRIPEWSNSGSVSVQGPKGERLLSFASNDYLGLAIHPALAEAASSAARRYGSGAGASRLLAGGSLPHRQLEERLAEFKQTEAAISFSTGYATAVGTIASLASRGDVLILDKLSHASLVDGARLSGALMRVFPHNNLDRLEHHLRWAREAHPEAGILVITESIFSMDGDACPLREMAELKDRYGAWLLLDEAHGLGVRGPAGRGLAHELNLADRVDIQLGTLGKALGSSGGFIAGSRSLIDFLINRARSLIFSTAPPPMNAAASLAALEILASPEGEKLQSLLALHRKRFAGALGFGQNESAIFPIVLGGASQAVKASDALVEKGLYVPSIRFPTVPRNAARLRVSLSAAHTTDDLERLVRILGELKKTDAPLYDGED